MNTPHSTAPAGVETVPSMFASGTRAARRHLARTGVIGRQLDQIAPGVAEVHTAPVTIDDRPATWVGLLNDLGQPIGDHGARMAAVGLLHLAFPGADWTSPQRYDVRTGHLTPETPTAPAELGINTAPVSR